MSFFYVGLFPLNIHVRIMKEMFALSLKFSVGRIKLFHNINWLEFAKDRF